MCESVDQFKAQNKKIKEQNNASMFSTIEQTVQYTPKESVSNLQRHHFDLIKLHHDSQLHETNSMILKLNIQKEKILAEKQSYELNLLARQEMEAKQGSGTDTENSKINVLPSSFPSILSNGVMIVQTEKESKRLLELQNFIA